MTGRPSSTHAPVGRNGQKPHNFAIKSVPLESIFFGWKILIKDMNNMKQSLFLRFKKFITQNFGHKGLLYRIQELENEIEQIKLQIKDAQLIKIENIIVEKITFEKLEHNYKIDSVNTDNLSGTMNIGTIYPSLGQKYTKNKDDVFAQSDPAKPKVNMFYK